MPKKVKKGKKEYYEELTFEKLMSEFNKIKPYISLISNEFVKMTVMGVPIDAEGGIAGKGHRGYVEKAGKMAIVGLELTIKNLEKDPSKLERFEAKEEISLETLKNILNDIDYKRHILFLPKDYQKYLSKPSMQCYCGRKDTTFKKCGQKYVIQHLNSERRYVQSIADAYGEAERGRTSEAAAGPIDLGARSKNPLREPEPEAYPEDLTAEEQEANEEADRIGKELYKKLEEESIAAGEELMKQVEQEKRKKEKKKEKNTKKKLRKKEERSAKLLQSLARRRLAKRDLDLRMEEKNKKNIATSILDDIVGDVVDKEQVRSVLDDIVGDVVDKEQVRSVLDDIVGNVVNKEAARIAVEEAQNRRWADFSLDPYDSEDEGVEIDAYMDMAAARRIDDPDKREQYSIDRARLYSQNPNITNEELQKKNTQLIKQNADLSTAFANKVSENRSLHMRIQELERQIQQELRANYELLQQSSMLQSQLQQYNNMANYQLQYGMTNPQLQ